jgi:hypothetical protein
MRWEIYDRNDKIVYTAHDKVDADMMWDEYGDGHYIRRIIPCRGCNENEGELMYDAYGISTGHWCYSCYDSPKYPYRKDRYDYEAYGERLDDNY